MNERFVTCRTIRPSWLWYSRYSKHSKQRGKKYFLLHYVKRDF